MSNFDHTGPEGMGSRTGRGMGQCMNRGGKGRMAMQGGMGNSAETVQMPEQGTDQNMSPDMGQNMIQGRCCRHGQRQNNRMRNCGMNAQGAGMGRGMGRGMGMGRGQGMQKGQGMGRGMVANQPETCGTPPAAGSDGTENNS